MAETNFINDSRGNTHVACSFAGLVLASFTLSASAETIRIAIGTQDTTINCAAGGLLIRELGLLEKYLPHDGTYKDAQYDVQWKNFTSGAPLTNEMVAGKLDFGAMADFPGSFNGVAFETAGKHSLFISVLSGSIKGSGNGIVVPSASSVQSLAELKGKTISVPFASTAHGMLLRAVAAQGWDPLKDVNIIAQPPEVAGSALQAGKIDAHADFVPFAELFPQPRFRPQDLRRLPGQRADLPWRAGRSGLRRRSTRKSSSPTCARASKPTSCWRPSRRSTAS